MTNTDADEAYGGEIWGFIDDVKANGLKQAIDHPDEIITLDAPDPAIKDAVLQRFRGEKLKNPQTGAIHIIKWKEDAGAFEVAPENSAVAA